MEIQAEPADKVTQNPWYSLALLASSFTAAEICHFLIGTTNRAMSQDLQYGDQSCLSQTDISVPKNVTACKKFPDETQCANATHEDQNYCEWNYNGLGIEYQVLAGPSFMAAYTIGGIGMGILADLYNRKNCMALFTVVFSISTILTGFAQEYWHLVLLRVGSALGASACQPLSAGMISDIFSQTTRGVAMGIVTVGVYLGLGLSFPIGYYVPDANILDMGWRWSYFISGIPGLVIAVLIFLTIKEPARQAVMDENSKELTAQDKVTARGISVRQVLAHYRRPVMITICIAGCIRQTASYSWSYNAALYYQTYYPEANSGIWLAITSIVGGTLGLVFGGWLSDRVVSKIGLQARAWVLTGTQIIAAPCALGVLYSPPPYAFISQFVTYIFSETWYSVLLAILVELAPAKGMTTLFGIFLFIFNNIGGNLPITVAPLSEAMGFREALILMVPVLMALSAVIFGITGFLLRSEAAAKKKSESREYLESN